MGQQPLNCDYIPIGRFVNTKFNNTPMFAHNFTFSAGGFDIVKRLLYTNSLALVNYLLSKRPGSSVGRAAD
jgi:hypothetical protein